MKYQILVLRKNLFKDKDELIDNMFNYLKQKRKEEFIQN